MRAGNAPDTALAAALVLAVAVYAALWPRDLYLFDEGIFLYESTRILRGDVFYRDFFEISAPLSHYAMAACLTLFGISFTVGRAVMAALHALIAVLMYGAARELGVRRSLAFVAALTHPALAYALFSQATPHWFGTALTVALVRLALSPRGQERTGRLGLVVGLLIATQHHKGLVMGAGGGAVILLDAALARWYGAPVPSPVAALGRYAAGIAAVVVPVFGTLLATAGPGPMVDALVRFPLTQYREYHRGQTWGSRLPVAFGDVSGQVVTWLPLFLPLTLAAGVGGVARRCQREVVRARMALGVLGAFAIGSVLYNPDAVHLALVAPVAMVAAAERLEAVLRWLERRRAGRPAAAALVAVLAVAVVVQLAVGLQVRRRWYGLRADTLLGPIDFADPNEPRLIEALRNRLRDAPVREVFGYPFYASLYLMVDAQNPTRFQLLKPGYSTPEQIAEAIRALETRRTPYVVVMPYWVNWNDDPVLRYLREHYEEVPASQTGPYPPYVLFHRVH